MGLRFCETVWAELIIKEIPQDQDGFQGHATDLLDDVLVANLIIDGILSREVSCYAQSIGQS